MILTIITLFLSAALVIIGISVYRKKHTNHAQTPIELVATGVAERVTNTFSYSTPNIPLLKSTYYDRLYVGKTVTLDVSLKAMFVNALFGFPTDPLIVSSFNYFDIDGNPFEEIAFDKIGAKNYIMLHDESEGVNYFLNRVTTHGISLDEVPPIVDQTTITLTEAGTDYVYTDFSGLIEVTVRNHLGYKVNDRLIRVYSREISEDDDEFLVAMMNTHNTIDYYIGFQISIHQLEDI